MELTDRVLQSLKGCIDVTVAQSVHGNRLRVTGFTDNPVEFGWVGMPDKMKVPGRHVYCCKSEDTGERVWVFADEVQVVDAPAHLVVNKMLEMIGNIESENALTPYDVVDILEGWSIHPDEWVEEEEDDDHCPHPWHEAGGGIYCPLCGADNDQS